MLKPAHRKHKTVKPLDMMQTDLERLLVHGLRVSHVENNVVTWASPPTEAEKRLAAELLSKKVSHSHA
jgi:hypothetical protein